MEDIKRLRPVTGCGGASRAGVLLCLMTCCALACTAAARARARQADQIPKSVSDMLVIPNGKNSDTLFLADPETGGIYTYQLTADSPVRLDFNLFHLFFRAAEFLHPTGLAYQNGKLLACDAENHTLFEINLTTRTPKPIFAGPPLDEPTTMTVSETGVITISGKHANYIVNFPAQAARPVTLPHQHETDNPRRLLYAGSELFVLNEDGDVYAVAQTDNAPSVTPVVTTRSSITREEQLIDFSYLKGIFYGVNKKQVTVFTRSRSGKKGYQLSAENALPVAINGAQSLKHARLAVTDSRLLVSDRDDLVVWNLPRPTPVEIRFENEADNSSIALVNVYQYLNSAGLLPLAPQIADRDYESLEKFLLAKRLLIAPISKKSAPTKTQLAQLICQFNPLFCAQSGLDNLSILNARVAQGQSLNLPANRLHAYVTITALDLAGKNVNTLLNEQLPAADMRAQYATQERLLELNGQEATPANVQGFFTKTNGSVTLPIMRWRMDALVPAADLATRSSSLRQLTTAHPGLLLLSKEEAPPGANAMNEVGSAAAAGDDQAQLFEQVKQNRLLLKSIINFPSTLPDMSDIKIGIAEQKTSVDDRHPDFMQDHESAWLPLQRDEVESDNDNATDPNAESSPPPTPTPMPARHVRPASEFRENDDHGTHVAGILAARPNALAPGLLPDVELFLVDTHDEHQMEIDIDQHAILNRNIFIFNVSQELDVDYFEAVHRKMPDWSRQLFIASAGNDGKDFQAVGPNKAPLIWRMPNVLGVSAVTTTTNLDEIGIMPRANFGKAYVDLVAPGQHIYSTTPGNSYTEAGGTSMAVPQVTAAAALLFKAEVREPLRIKARLIYTADWLPQLQNKVWGGLLNVQRATWLPGENLLQTNTAPGVRAIKLAPNANVNIKIIFGVLDTSTALTTITNTSIPFADVLRITPQRDGEGLRVIFLQRENGARHLKIVDNARLSGLIRCRTFQEADAQAATLGAVKQCADDEAYKNGIRVENIKDYVARTPDSVIF